jgi:hypothetical protein
VTAHRPSFIYLYQLTSPLGGERGRCGRRSGGAEEGEVELGVCQERGAGDEETRGAGRLHHDARRRGCHGPQEVGDDGAHGEYRQRRGAAGGLLVVLRHRARRASGAG